MPTPPRRRAGVRTATDLQAAAMTEAQLQTHTIRIAEALHWRVYHTHDSRRSQPGFPDLFLINPTHHYKMIFVELKTETGRLTHDQATWLNLLRLAGAHTHLWRPTDLLNQTIHRTLSPGGPTP